MTGQIVVAAASLWWVFLLMLGGSTTALMIVGVRIYDAMDRSDDPPPRRLVLTGDVLLWTVRALVAAFVLSLGCVVLTNLH